MTLIEEGSELNVPPHHLATVSFLNHSYEVAMFACAAMTEAIDVLKKDKGRKNVHDIRVSFRRWFSIWNVLQDGWDSKRYRERIGDDLRRAYKALGEVRDWDVVVKIATQSMVPQLIIDKMENRRDRARDRSFKVLKSLKLGRLLSRLEKYLNKRFESLSSDAEKSTQPAKSAYKQLEEFLEDREIETRELLSTASTLKELHGVRLSIKAWRYLLAEFFGLSSVELVRAQQLLGQLNDIERLRIFLQDCDEDGKEEPIENLHAESEKLLESWSELKIALPF
ncbi:MAG: CHAD domain-containing protein, partial [Mycobacteriaceae bacterium]|nr:CHAD domain-containing protein [Mycobacteriaceae bacterium]